MKKILFMVPYPHGRAASQRFRFEHFLKFIEENGSHWDFQAFVSSEDWNSLYVRQESGSKLTATLSGFFRRFGSLFETRKYDFIFIHREITPMGPPLFEWIIAKVLKKKIIYDFDDAIWLPDQNRENTLWRFLKWRSKVRLICKWSWKVSVGNEYLGDFARQYNEKVVVVPTVVDTEVHSPEIRNQSDYAKTLSDKETGDRRPIIGWTGSHSTLRYLDRILPALQELEKKIEFEFRVIANKNPELPLKNYCFIEWNKESEIDDLATFDIGVMPLPDDEWSKGKCGFKLIQYLAMGIPAVASPVGVNQKIIIHGENGYMATSKTEWIEGLKILLQNKSLRSDFGAQGRKQIINKFSVDSQKEVFLKLFAN